MKNLHSRFSRNPAGLAVIALASLAIAACGGSDNSPGPAPTYTVGGTLSGLAAGQTVTLADNNADSLKVVGNGTFTFKTPLAKSGAYAVTVTAQPAGQQCTVSSGSGTVSADVTSVSVSCVSTLYTVGGTVTGLKPGASITLQNNGADSLTVSANGTFSFATSLAYNATYTVTATAQPTAQGLTCAVTNGFSVVTGNVTTVAVTCGPANQYVYVVNFGAGTVSQFLAGSDGTLTALSTASVTTGTTGTNGNTPMAIAVSPNYRYVYVTNYADGTVAQYSIAPGGVLTPLASVPGTIPYFTGTVPTGNTMMPGPTAIAVDPHGKYVYVLNATEATITEFSIGTMGNLTPLATTLAASTLPTSTQLTAPATITPGSQPPVLAGQIAVDPAGRFLFVTSPVSNTITQYSIDATTGALTVSPAAPLMTGTAPIGIAINPAGTFAYVANSSDSPGDLSQFSLGGTGLQLLTPPTAASNGVNPSFVAIDPTGKYLYETDNFAGSTGTISQYTIDATGGLTLMTVNSVGAGTSPQWITVDLTAQYVYVTNTFDGTLGQYVITPANSIITGAIPGALTALSAGPVGGLNTPTAIAVAYGQ